ncbi:MAG: MFS transporter [Candidatus Eremiobacteraeota bacterium]|nr:MFS transporter [Candidatus Eremiobacteraeota bacterium]
MVCLGGVYAWSIFVPPLRSEHGLTTAQTQFIFGLTIAVFAIVMIFAGRMEKNRGPRLTAIIGAILFCSGYLLASFSGGRWVFLLGGIGVLSGAGIGFGYLCALATPIKWFPRYKGLITGLSVAGFGGGAILLSFLAKNFLEKGMPVLDIFRLVGITYGIIIFLSALGFSVPQKQDEETSENSLSMTGLFKEKKLWALFLGMFAGTFAGLLITGNLKPIGLAFGVSEGTATIAISFLAIGNAAGRIIWGRLSDILGGKRSIILALSSLSLSALLLLVGARHDAVFIFLSMVIGFGFGANFVLFATEVSHVYGIHKLGIVYPYVFLSFGLAGIIGPLIGGKLFDITKNYQFAIILSAIICAAGALSYFFLMQNNKKPEAK